MPASRSAEATSPGLKVWATAYDTLQAAVPAVASALVDALKDNPTSTNFRAFIDLYQIVEARRYEGRERTVEVELVADVLPPENETPDEGRVKPALKKSSTGPKT